MATNFEDGVESFESCEARMRKDGSL